MLFVSEDDIVLVGFDYVNVYCCFIHHFSSAITSQTSRDHQPIELREERLRGMECFKDRKGEI